MLSSHWGRTGGVGQSWPNAPSQRLTGSKDSVPKCQAASPRRWRQPAADQAASFRPAAGSCRSTDFVPFDTRPSIELWLHTVDDWAGVRSALDVISRHIVAAQRGN